MDNTTLTILSVGFTAVVGQLFNSHRDARARRWAKADRLETALAAAAQIQLLKLTQAAAELSRAANQHATGAPPNTKFLADRLSELLDAMPQATGHDAKEEDPCTRLTA